MPVGAAEARRGFESPLLAVVAPTRPSASPSAPGNDRNPGPDCGPCTVKTDPKRPVALSKADNRYSAGGAATMQRLRVTSCSLTLTPTSPDTRISSIREIIVPTVCPLDHTLCRNGERENGWNQRSIDRDRDFPCRGSLLRNPNPRTAGSEQHGRAVRDVTRNPGRTPRGWHSPSRRPAGITTECRDPGAASRSETRPACWIAAQRLQLEFPIIVSSRASSPHRAKAPCH